MPRAARKAPREVVRERLRIPCARETLDAELAYPAAGEPETAVLWLAPHPHLGGRMDNNVVRHLAARAAEDGAAVLRFDYRGVGESTLALPAGTSRYAHWEAMESARSYEQLLPDALAAFAALLGAVGPTPRRVAAGYSLGAILAGIVAARAGATHVLCISPPVVKVGLAGLSGCALPKLFVGGDDDFAFDARRLREELASLPGPHEFVPLAGADHFFRQEEERLYRTVAPFLFGGQP